MKVGVVGLGDMGFGIAKNLISNGFEVYGFDLNPDRLKRFQNEGGVASSSVSELGEVSDIVFVMVLNAEQAKSVALGDEGLSSSMAAGSIVVITATIGRGAVLDIESYLAEKGIYLVDSPVSGGQGGANNGSLTLMASGKPDVFKKCDSVFNAIAENINYVGEKCGDGQTVKHVLSALTATSYVGIFEALVLGANAGVDMQSLYNVISTSSVGNYIFKDSAKCIMERKFKDTGAGIGTMNKDVGLSMELARDTGASLPLTALSREMFQAGISAYPDEDNWCIVKLIEQMSGGTEVKGLVKTE